MDLGRLIFGSISCLRRRTIVVIIVTIARLTRYTFADMKR